MALSIGSIDRRWLVPLKSIDTQASNDMAKSPISPILILDDERRWRGELREVLTDAGFDCMAVSEGEVAVETVRGDLGRKIKLVLADELLLQPDIPNGERQHYQGSDARKHIHANRPDIQFIVISDLPRLASLEHQDPEQAAIAALAQRDELSDGANVIAMFDKIGLANPKTAQARYKKLIEKIRPVLGETKANVKPALFIGLGIDRSKYEELATAAGIKNGNDFRLYRLCEKYGSDRSRYVDEFLRKQAFEKGIKPFLEVLAQEGAGAKQPERKLDFGLVQYIRTFIRKPNSAKLLPASMKVGSSEFRVFFMLAYRAEKGDTPLIREQDYVFEDRKGQVTDLGTGISEYSLNQSTGNAYDAIDDSEDLDRDDFSGDRHELAQRQVAEDTAYEIDKSSGRRRQKAKISKPQSKLKLPVKRARDYLKKENLGTLDLHNEAHGDAEKLSVNYVATFSTGIILYPVDPIAIPEIDLQDSTKTRLHN
jgi:CheY-like chemotaxis protein